jgi:transcriptional regulator with XRE-family HTH domain
MNLKELRADLGLTQNDLARTLECTQQKVSHIEKGRTELSLKDLAKITKAYNITTDQIKSIILEELKERE